MSKYNGMPINFDVADAAKAEIARLRRLWDQQHSDPADVVAIAWGTMRRNSGAESEGVVVSFYGRSDRPYIARGIETTSGLEVVFFITEPDYERFQGRRLDFDADRGFYLRP